MNGMRPPEPDPQGRPVPDPVGEARRGERAALELVRSGQLDADTRRELQIAIDQLRADLVNGENPEASLGRVRQLVGRALDGRPGRPTGTTGQDGGGADGSG